MEQYRLGLNHHVVHHNYIASLYFIAGGPYANFAGTDATRGLGTFSLVPRKGKENEPLTEKQYENAARWVKLFKGEDNCTHDTTWIMYYCTSYNSYEYLYLDINITILK